jgi:hypothetical protein
MLLQQQSLTLLLKKSLTWIVSCVTRSAISKDKTTMREPGSFQSIKVIYIRKGQLPGHDWYERKFIHSYHHDQGGYAMAIKHDQRKS